MECLEFGVSVQSWSKTSESLERSMLNRLLTTPNRPTDASDQRAETPPTTFNAFLFFTKKLTTNY